jgi:hypothetical protein
VFYAWREQVTQAKTKKINFKLRVWKSLQKFREIQREKKIQALSLIKIEDECRKNLLRITYNALKLSKQIVKKEKA